MKKHWIHYTAAVCCLLLTACATPQRKQLGVVLWPKEPAEPRFIYEGILRSESDLIQVSRGERLRRAAVGLTDRKQQPVFKKPLDVAARQGLVAVTDTIASGITLFDIPRRQVMHVGRSEDGKLRNPLGLALDNDLNIYVADGGAKQVVVFNATGHFLKRIGTGELLTHPVDVAVNEDASRIFVVDSGGLSSSNHRVVVFDAEGNMLNTIGTRGTAPGEFNLPVSVAYGPDRNLYVLDAGNFRVQVFDGEGHFLRAWGEVGNGLGNFARPRGLALDSEGNVYVSDAAYRKVQVFTPEGHLLLWLGDDGLKDDPGQYVLPAGVAVDETNRVYVVDQIFLKVEVLRRLRPDEAARIVASRPVYQQPAAPPAEAPVSAPAATGEADVLTVETAGPGSQAPLASDAQAGLAPAAVGSPPAEGGGNVAPAVESAVPDVSPSSPP